MPKGLVKFIWKTVVTWSFVVRCGAYNTQHIFFGEAGLQHLDIGRQDRRSREAIQRSRQLEVVNGFWGEQLPVERRGSIEHVSRTMTCR
jgi:hypothetical protein